MSETSGAASSVRLGALVSTGLTKAEQDPLRTTDFFCVTVDLKSFRSPFLGGLSSDKSLHGSLIRNNLFIQSVYIFTQK